MIMIMVIVIYYWLTITINYRDTKYKTKKENYGCPLISLGYRIPLLIAEKVYQMTVESQSRRVLYSSDEYGGIIISTVNAFPNDFLSRSHCSPECTLPSWCLSGIAGVATCHQGPLLKVAILAKIVETAINCQIVNDMLKKVAKAFWKWHIGRKWQKWRTIAKFLTKIQMRWQRGPFESGDFGENGSNGEQSPNYMKEDHRSNGRNFCSCEKKAEKFRLVRDSSP